MAAEPTAPRRSTSRRSDGARIEALARDFLQRQGLVPVAANANYRGGELDLVMRDGDTLVFVEVRLRASARFGGAAASINAAKQARLWRSAQHFLCRYPAPPPCRFDAVCIDGADLTWLRHILLA